MLMSLSFFGEVHATGVTLKEEDQKKGEYKTKFLSSSKYSMNKATYLYLEDGDRRDSQYQLEAFLTFWLSYFILPSPLDDGLHGYVFSLATQITRGNNYP